ncbi:MAG: DUF4259 domain-containing protein [Candidatus Ozemobacteraceae bacterium]
MGNWGVGNFDNDIACDWVYGLQKTDDLLFIEKTVEFVVNQEHEYLEADPAREALAAIEAQPD